MSAQAKEMGKPGLQWLTQEMRGDAFWRQLPAEIRAGLTPEQEKAIRSTAAGVQKIHPVDYRLSLRLPILGHVYLVLLAGREGRNQLRRSMDHALRPRTFLQYLVTIIFALVAINLVGAVGVLLYAALR